MAGSFGTSTSPSNDRPESNRNRRISNRDRSGTSSSSTTATPADNTVAQTNSINMVGEDDNSEESWASKNKTTYFFIKLFLVVAVLAIILTIVLVTTPAAKCKPRLTTTLYDNKTNFKISHTGCTISLAFEYESFDSDSIASIIRLSENTLSDDQKLITNGIEVGLISQQSGGKNLVFTLFKNGTKFEQIFDTRKIPAKEELDPNTRKYNRILLTYTKDYVLCSFQLPTGGETKSFQVAALNNFSTVDYNIKAIQIGDKNINNFYMNRIDVGTLSAATVVKDYCFDFERQ